jgi:tetratricopeptide (TPR) repeat protein
MGYPGYVDQARKAAQLVDEGKYQEARTILEDILDSDLADLDRAMMCMNLAVVADKLGEDTEAVRWYDRGIARERALGRHFVAESKAGYLAGKGRIRESLSLYESLLSRSTIDDESKQRVAQNIAALRASLAEAERSEAP